jgi:hypothetical protein
VEDVPDSGSHVRSSIDNANYPTIVRGIWCTRIDGNTEFRWERKISWKMML